MIEHIPLLTFAEKVAPIVRLCNREIANAGGRRQAFDRTLPGYYRGGYRFPAPVKRNSEADYALRILAAVKVACTAATDPEERCNWAWDAGQLVFDAQRRFSSFVKASAKGVHKREEDATKRWTKWQREIDRLRPGLSASAAITIVARKANLSAPALKKGLQRHRARQTKNAQTPKKNARLMRK
jgi:hypothetical protein